MEKVTRILSSTFAPLRDRNVSLYLGGQTVSQFGTWMQATAQAWVVWQVSHSTQALGMVTMLSSLPMMFLGAFAGVWADRLDRRKLLVVTQALAMVLAFIFAFLVQTNAIQLWQIYALSVALGCVNALDMPAAASFVSDLSGAQQVRGAVVLNNMIVQASRTAGPALAGLVMGAMGVAPAFWINGASFLAVIGSLLVVRAHQVRKPPEARGNGEMREAFRFIGSNPRFQELLLLCVCVTFFVWGAGGLIPAIASERLHAGPEMLGWISAASGAGALFGAICVVPLAQHVRRPGRVMTAALVWVGLWLAGAAFSQSAAVWVAGMFLGSLASPVVMTTSSGLLQLIAPPEMKARLVAVYMMVAFGMAPFGALLAGYLGQIFGAAGAVLIFGVALIAAGIGILAARPGLRQWQPAPALTGD